MIPVGRQARGMAQWNIVQGAGPWALDVGLGAPQEQGLGQGPGQEQGQRQEQRHRLGPGQA